MLNLNDIANDYIMTDMEEVGRTIMVLRTFLDNEDKGNLGNLGRRSLRLQKASMLFVGTLWRLKRRLNKWTRGGTRVDDWHFEGICIQAEPGS